MTEKRKKKDAHIYDNKQANSHYTLSLQTKALKSDPCTVHSAHACINVSSDPTDQKNEILIYLSKTPVVFAEIKFECKFYIKFSTFNPLNILAFAKQR